MRAQDNLTKIEKEYQSKKINDPSYYEITAKYAQLLLVNNKVSDSFRLLEKNINLAAAKKDIDHVSFLYAVMAMQYFVIADIPSSDRYYELSKKNYKSIKSNRVLGSIYYTGGWLSIRKNDKIEAVNYFLKSVNHYEKEKKTKPIYRNLAVIYNELASLYGDWSDLEFQEKYAQKSLNYALLQDDKQVHFLAYMMMGHVYSEKLKIELNTEELKDTTEMYYLKAYDIFNSNNLIYKSDLSYVTLNISKLYLKYYPDSYNSKALKFATISNQIAVEHEAPNLIASTLIVLAELKLKENKVNDAQSLFIQALKSSDSSLKKELTIDLEVFENLAKIEQNKGNYFNANYYLNKYIDTYRTHYDSKKINESRRMISEFEKKIQLQEFENLQLLAHQKDQRILLLNALAKQKEQEFNNLKLLQENQNKQLEVAQLATDSKLRELEFSKFEAQVKSKDLLNYQEKLKYKDEVNRYYALIIISVLLILLLTLFLLRQRTKRMQQKEILYHLAMSQERHRNKISILTALLEGQEKERARLARDLHDSLGGLLSATKLQLSDFNSKIPEHEKSEVENIITHIDYAVSKLRKISHNLMPDLLIKFGLEIALKEFAERMQNEQLQIHTQFLNYETKLSKDKELFVYRIVQELVSNAIKHANASQILIQFSEDKESYHVTVEDDGKGFDFKSDFEDSAGILNIQSRIEFLKGSVDFHSVIDQGSSIEFNFPKDLKI
nr:sensor histidine kinase [uncultured Flavobacterium sp.]